jgi:hypothetical protein
MAHPTRSVTASQLRIATAPLRLRVRQNTRKNINLSFDCHQSRFKKSTYSVNALTNHPHFDLEQKNG